MIKSYEFKTFFRDHGPVTSNLVGDLSFKTQASEVVLASHNPTVLLTRTERILLAIIRGAMENPGMSCYDAVKQYSPYDLPKNSEGHQAKKLRNELAVTVVTDFENFLSARRRVVGMEMSIKDSSLVKPIIEARYLEGETMLRRKGTEYFHTLNHALRMAAKQPTSIESSRNVECFKQVYPSYDKQIDNFAQRSKQ